MNVLGLGIAPIVRPVYGGQRRTAAFRDEYQKRGIPFRYVAVYSNPRAAHSSDDFPAGAANSPFDGRDGLRDVCAGLFSAQSPELLDHLAGIASATGATHVHLDQCFLMPAFERLRQRFPTLRLIYASHNVEGALKLDTLRLRGLPAELAGRAASLVDAWERAAVRDAELVVAASAADADTYRQYGARDVVVARNGVGDFPVGTLSRELRNRIRDVRFLLTVGSSHPPNADGFIRLLLDPSFRFREPPTLLVCGGMGYAIGRGLKMSVGGPPDSNIVLLPEISDPELGALKQMCHGFFLPILSGGGSNLKTAEALITGKHIVGTRMSFRGFEEFLDEPGVVVAETTQPFKQAISQILRTRQPSLDGEQVRRRQSVRWDRSLEAFFQRLASLPA